MRPALRSVQPRGSLLETALTLCVARRWTLVVVGIAMGLSAGVFSLTRPREYMAALSFVPQGSRSGAGMAGLAAQFGIAIPMTSDEPLSPVVYADLLRSDQFLYELLDPSTHAPLAERGISLFSALAIDSVSDSVSRARALIKVRQRLHIRSDVKTGVVRVEVVSRHPSASQFVSEALFTMLLKFNVEKRQGRARAERQFTAGRLAVLRQDLRVSEESLLVFLQRNRNTRSSPILSAENARLERAVGLKQQLASALAESFERARIDEVRETPAITVLESTVPVLPVSRGTVGRTLFGGVVGGFLAVAWFTLIAAFAHVRGADHWVAHLLRGILPFPVRE